MSDKTNGNGNGNGTDGKAKAKQAALDVLGRLMRDEPLPPSPFDGHPDGCTCGGCRRQAAGRRLNELLGCAQLPPAPAKPKPAQPAPEVQAAAEVEALKAELQTLRAEAERRRLLDEIATVKADLAREVAAVRAAGIK
jgi:hypothetical protein